MKYNKLKLNKYFFFHYQGAEYCRCCCLYLFSKTNNKIDSETVIVRLKWPHLLKEWSGHLVSPLVCKGPWLSTVVFYCWCTVTVHQFFCISLTSKEDIFEMPELVKYIIILLINWITSFPRYKKEYIKILSYWRQAILSQITVSCHNSIIFSLPVNVPTGLPIFVSKIIRLHTVYDGCMRTLPRNPKPKWK